MQLLFPIVNAAFLGGVPDKPMSKQSSSRSDRYLGILQEVSFFLDFAMRLIIFHKFMWGKSLLKRYPGPLFNNNFPLLYLAKII